MYAKKAKKTTTKARNILAVQAEEQQKERNVFKLFLNVKHSIAAIKTSYNRD